MTVTNKKKYHMRINAITQSMKLFLWSLLVVLVIIPAFARANFNETDTGNDKKTGTEECKILNSERAQRNCQNFVKRYQQTYIFKQVNKHEFLEKKELTKTDNGTIFILPPGEYKLSNSWIIKDAEHIAIIGNDDKDGYRTYLSLAADNLDESMFRLENCKNCMIANIKINPVSFDDSGPHYHLAVKVTGEKSDVLFQNITAHHYSEKGYFLARGIRSIELYNIDLEHIAAGIVRYMTAPAIHLDHCDNINIVKLKTLNLNPSYIPDNSGLLKLTDPIKFKISDSSTVLHSGSDLEENTTFAEIAFTKPERYSSVTVDGKITNLTVGTHTSLSGEEVAWPLNWPKKWHSLRLSNNKAADHNNADDEKIKGTINIRYTDLPDHKILGTELFSHLKINIDNGYEPKIAKKTPHTLPATTLPLSMNRTFASQRSTLQPQETSALVSCTISWLVGWPIASVLLGVFSGLVTYEIKNGGRGISSWLRFFCCKDVPYTPQFNGNDEGASTSTTQF